MTFSALPPQAKNGRRHARLFSGALLAFPLLVLFSPRVSLGFTHARIDELLVLGSLAPAIVHFLRFGGHTVRPNAPHFRAFLVLFALFAFGLMVGDGDARWSQSNLKLVFRPVVVIANVLVVRYWIHRAGTRWNHLVTALITASLLAGGIGYLALSNSDMAAVLTRLYSGVERYDDPIRFDMSRRAMSVFAGYDQASVTYALAGVLALFLFFHSRSASEKAGSVFAIGGLLLSIVTSGRIGFVCFLFGALALVLLKDGKVRGVGGAGVLVGILLYGLVSVGEYIIPNSATLERFEDVRNLFDVSSTLPIWERSEGVRLVMQTQVYGVEYPEGMGVVFGVGDRGEFVSDVAYVSLFVKYGLLGWAALLYAFAAIGAGGFRTGKRIRNAALEGRLTVCAALPGLITLFAVGGFKGGLYFLTYKIGELFAFVLALCVVEGERFHALRGQVGSRPVKAEPPLAGGVCR